MPLTDAGVTSVGNTYRMLQAFIFVPLSDPRPGVPALYLRDWQHWDAMMFGIIGALLTWIGDVLVVRTARFMYPCFIDHLGLNHRYIAVT